MTARAPGKIALTVPFILLLAMVAIFLALHSGSLPTVGHHVDIGPAVAPASVPNGTTNSNPQAPAGSANVNQSSSSAGAPATGSSHTTVGTVGSGGPEDAGPGVVKQGSGNSSPVCAPRVCRR